MDGKYWTFPTLAYVWEYRNGAIATAGDRPDALPEPGRLVATACWMVEDLYKSFFRECVWTSGVHDYIGATTPVVVEELPHHLHDQTATGGSSDRRNR